MIVCHLCGTSIADPSSRCPKCSGRAIERSNPIKSLLSSPQKRGSPDRWADKYTTPKSPSSLSSSPLSLGYRTNGSQSSNSQSQRPGLARTETFDVALTASSDAELARVYGSVLDRAVQHPQCRKCGTDIRSGMKIYLARHDFPPLLTGDTLCKGCYTEAFPIGVCHRCQLPIIGDRDEGFGGQHISARGLKWHGKCFTCSVCDKGPNRQITPLLLPNASPACHDCYELYFSTGIQQASKSIPSSTTAGPSHRYPRPGALSSNTQLPSKPSVTAEEIKGLLRPAREHTGEGSLSKSKVQPPLIVSSSRQSPLSQTETFRRNDDFPKGDVPSAKQDIKTGRSLQTTSVIDRIRQFDAQISDTRNKSKVHQGDASSNHNSPRKPLHPMKNHNT
ncbi:hypothetical protein V866_008308 [Kwoniella sp. B9012]|uniref:LIM zinc-binding domain-containing protein n=1 Tax=Kwoniella europaea PYCC6329 TaxID=1423913 RepID=A0AAX4KUS1_9TREE